MARRKKHETPIKDLAGFETAEGDAGSEDLSKIESLAPIEITIVVKQAPPAEPLTRTIFVLKTPEPSRGLGSYLKFAGGVLAGLVALTLIVSWVTGAKSLPELCDRIRGEPETRDIPGAVPEGKIFPKKMNQKD